MDLYNIITTALTLITGGGWFIYYKANQRKAEGEATVAEADGWKAQQDVYQQTIIDLKESCEYIRQDRNLLRDENKELRKENNELREKINEMERQLLTLRKELSRQGRRIDSIVKETK